MKVVKVIGQISRGGFGVVDEVVCDDGQRYARKTYSPADALSLDSKTTDKFKARFVREVKTQKLLPDSYFIPVLFEDLNAPSPYFIMPIAEAIYKDEIALAKAEGRHPDGLGDILNALEYLHDKGLVHRDLKPQNILKHNGVWKLADFGLITQDKDILSYTITTSSGAYGTLHYCAPEQAVEFKRITAQADIYSFGAILHDIYADGARAPCSELTGPGEVGHIIERCTKLDKERRYKSIRSLRAKLLTVLSKESARSITDLDKEWQEKFEKLELWNKDIFEEFLYYLRRAGAAFENIIFKVISEDCLDSLKEISEDLFNEFCLLYLDWVYKKSFNFDYCDVVVDNVYYMYTHADDVEVKAKCAISSAELGKSHNRFYVMEYVVRMSNPEIDENLAFRIGMDIELDERNKINFQTCVRQIRKTVTSYHPAILAVL